jgi:3-oxoacyl-[acyl-carrier protein] reductase
LVQAGVEVVVADVDVESAARVAVEVAPERDPARHVRLDVTDSAAVMTLARDLGRVDILVNLAGVIRNAPLSKITDEDFGATMTTHVNGTLNTMRAFAPVMRGTGYGRIVNTSSIAARGIAGGGSYGAAKGAIESLTRAAALELAPDGITANCVAPGLVNAGLFLSAADDVRERLTQRVPMGRLAAPAEVAACIAFLASPAAGYVTGQTLTVCGGLSVGY